MLDVVLKGGRVIDPVNGRDEIADVAFSGGKVARVAPGIADAATRVVDCTGRIVTPGLIDLHTHVYVDGTSIGVDADALVAQSGTTTFVDAGTAGPANFAGFRKHVIERSRARIIPYLNVAFAGIHAFSARVMVGECQDLRMLDAVSVVDVGSQHLDLICGIKVRIGAGAGGVNGVHPLEIAIECAEALDLPVMCHLDNPPPSRREVLSLMRRGDVITHCFRPFPGAPIDRAGAPREEVLESRARGIIYDIGHGKGSFGFETARGMVAHGFYPDVISSDVHVLSIDGPAYDALVTMSKFLCLGMPLVEVIRAATENAARAIRRPELGNLSVGSPGDAAILDIETGRHEYIDSVGESMIGDQRLRCVDVVLAGALWSETAPVQAAAAQ